MARPRRLTDDALLAIARATFLEHGPSASLQRIAEQAGISQPGLLKRFGSKEAFLVRALAPPDELPWVERLFAGPDDRPVDAQLREIAVGALLFLRAAIPAVMTLRAAGHDLSRALGQADAGPLRVRAALVAFFAAAGPRLRPVNPDHAAAVLIGSLESVVVTAHRMGLPLEDDAAVAHAHAVVDLLWGGLMPRSEA